MKHSFSCLDILLIVVLIWHKTFHLPFFDILLKPLKLYNKLGPTCSKDDSYRLINPGLVTRRTRLKVKGL